MTKQHVFVVSHGFPTDLPGDSWLWYHNSQPLDLTLGKCKAWIPRPERKRISDWGFPWISVVTNRLLFHRHKGISENDINRKILICAFGDVLKLERREKWRSIHQFSLQIVHNLNLLISYLLVFATPVTTLSYRILLRKSIANHWSAIFTNLLDCCAWGLQQHEFLHKYSLWKL